jgi:hypothetical protein
MKKILNYFLIKFFEIYSRTIPNSVTTDNVDHSNMFPLHDEFAQIPFNSINITSLNQENLFTSSKSISESIEKSF